MFQVTYIIYIYYSFCLCPKVETDNFPRLEFPSGVAVGATTGSSPLSSGEEVSNTAR